MTSAASLPTRFDPRDGGAVMFDSIARRYDLLNRVLSMGLDGGWRKRALDAIDPKPGQILLDLCTGTGDFGFQALAREPRLRVLGFDLACAMMRVGREKSERRGTADRFRFGVADAEQLPLSDASIDGAMIGFGIRNVPQRDRALAELARVLKPGCPVAILEFGIPPNPLFRPLYFFYFRRILPKIGGLLSGNRGAYDYLPESVRRFPPPTEFEAMARSAGFRRTRATRLSLGIVTLYEFRT